MADTGNAIAGQAGAIIREAWRLILASPLAVLLYLALMIGGSTLVDTRGLGSGADFAILVVDIGATFALTMILIVEGVPGRRQGNNGFGTYFGLSFLTGLGILVGFLCLIVPGIYLWARWAPAYGYALADGMDVSSAMSRSWAATEGRVLPITAALMVPACLSLGGAALFAILSDELATVPPVWILGVNALVYIGSVLSVAVGLAVYSRLARYGAQVAGVFE